MRPFRYRYLGDRWTDPRLAGLRCAPVCRPDGRCIVSVPRASALVDFETGARHVVARRRLRLLAKEPVRCAAMPRLDTLLAFLAEDPSDAFTRFALAQEYARAGDLEAARAHYETLRREQPGYVGTYYHLGKLLEALGVRADAAEVYRAGIAVATTARDLHARAELQTALLAAEGVGDE